MTTWLESIQNGLTLATAYGILLLVPSTVISAIIHKGKLSIARFFFNVLFFIYICCVLALVFFPLPGPDFVFEGYKLQLIPFYAVYDTIAKFSWFSVFQILFNVVMTLPFGAYFYYCRSKTFSQVVLFTLAFSLFIELGQLSGLFFIYPGSYRCCDIDDLILNTMGGFLGAFAVEKIKKLSLAKKIMMA